MTRVFSRIINEHRFATAHLSRVERLLTAIGAERAFTDAVLGDLAEERAMREARDGRLRASLWYLRDALRSVPHLARNAWTSGSDETRSRIVTIVAAGAFAITAVVTVVLQQGSAAARIVSAYGTARDGVVINNLSAIQLPMSVTDRRGLPLPAKGVRFRQIAGTPISLSRSGVVKCRDEADARILASIGSVYTTVVLHCRPVQMLRADPWMDFVQGDAPRIVQYAALSPQSTFVGDLRGTMTVADEGVATVRDNRIVEPNSVGSTPLTIRVGDKTSIVAVTVFQRVSSFAKLSRMQQYPAVALRLELGVPVTQPLPRGTFWLKYLPRSADDPAPAIDVRGQATCTVGNRASTPFLRGGEIGRYCEVTGDDASVTLVNTEGARPVEASLALDRILIP